MTQPSVHPFDRATRLVPNADGSLTGRFDPAYAHAVGPFGGITAATLLNAALGHPARLGTPVALTVNYAGPVAEGEFLVEAVPVRTNRSTQHWSITLTQGGEVSTTASAVFAMRRETWTATDVGFPEAPPPAEVPRLATEKLTPWFRNYDIRLIRGRPIDTSRPAEELDSLTQFWIRDEPARPLDFTALAAMCDAFFPRIFVRRPLWVAAGTVSLTTYFHADEALLAAQGERPVLGQARASHFGRGYHDQSAEIWSDAGALLATSHQVVYYKE